MAHETMTCNILWNLINSLKLTLGKGNEKKASFALLMIFRFFGCFHVVSDDASFGSLNWLGK